MSSEATADVSSPGLLVVLGGGGVEWDQPEIPAPPSPLVSPCASHTPAPQAEGSHASGGCGPERPCARGK